MPGPPPKHPSVRARRNNPKADFRSLPAEGRTGAAPPWPLGPDLATISMRELAEERIAELDEQLADAEDGRTKGRLRRELNKSEATARLLGKQLEHAQDAEIALWEDLWAMPQAVLWEESHATREVAQYVRWKIRAEHGDLKAATEARMLSDRLGLNPLALLRLRAEVERVEEAEDRGVRRRGPRPVPGKGKGKGGGDDPRAVLRLA